MSWGQRLVLLTGLILSLLSGESRIEADALAVKDMETNIVHYFNLIEGHGAQIVDQEGQPISPSFIAATATPSILMLTIDGKEIEENDYVRSQPILTARIAPGITGDIASYNIKIVEVEGFLTIVSTASVLSATTNAEIEVVYPVTQALEGNRHYQVIVSASDSSGKTDILTSPIFKVAKNLKIENAINGPNPFNPNQTSTHIEYSLSQDADIDLYIYSLSGEQLWHQEMMAGTSGATAGFNQLIWDGKNRYSETVANGVYIAYILAKKSDEKAVAKIKMAVLK
jgi:hypothetical protein